MQPVSSTKVYDLAQRNKVSIGYRLENGLESADAKLYTIQFYVNNKNYLNREPGINLTKLVTTELAHDHHRYLTSRTNCNQDTSPKNVFPSPTVAIHSWAIQNKIPINYVLLNERFKPKSLNESQTIFHYRLYLGIRFYFDGHGYTHQQARNNCALRAFNFLRQNRISAKDLKIVPSSNSKNQEQTKSDISVMYERAEQLGLAVEIISNGSCTVTYKIGENYSVTAKGYDQQSAKQLAAKKMLKILPINYNQSKSDSVTRIYRLAQLRQVKVEFIPLANKEKFTYQLKFGDRDIVEGHGTTKYLAKQNAAESLLDKLEKNVLLPPPPPKGLLKRDGNNENPIKQEKKHVHFVEDTEKAKSMSSYQSACAVLNLHKNHLIEMCQKLKINIDYLDKMDENEHEGSARFQSIISLSIDDRVLVQFRGQGSSLMWAQENASVVVIDHLKALVNGYNKVLKSKMNEKKRQPICA